jgi:hypothetical protein
MDSPRNDHARLRPEGRHQTIQTPTRHGQNAKWLQGLGGEAMKVWKTNIDVYVMGDNEQDAIQKVIGELDYVFSHMDSPLQAYSHPESAQLETETED